MSEVALEGQLGVWVQRAVHASKAAGVSLEG